MANNRISREKNGQCACAEGYIAQYDNNGVLSGFFPTGLYVHDCRYIQLRNSKIRRAERLADEHGVPFLKAMDFLMSNPAEEQTYAKKHGFETSLRVVLRDKDNPIGAPLQLVP